MSCTILRYTPLPFGFVLDLFAAASKAFQLAACRIALRDGMPAASASSFSSRARAYN